MTDPAAAPGAMLTDDGPGWPCSDHGCTQRAMVAMAFRNQPGHVHECAQHEAELREWCDVTEVAPLPCPFSHGNGETWTDEPRELT